MRVNIIHTKEEKKRKNNSLHYKQKQRRKHEMTISVIKK